MDFPPPPSGRERPLELVLECGSWGATVTLLNGDYEFDVCAIQGGLVRYCTECGFATVWKRPEAGGAPRRPVPKVERKLEPPQRAAVAVEHAGLELEEQESLTQPFTPYVAPLETVKLEPRAAPGGAQAELHVEERGEDRGNLRAERHAQVRAESEARTATTTTTAVDDRRQRVRA